MTSPVTFLTNGVALAAVYKRVRNSLGGNYSTQARYQEFKRWYVRVGVQFSAKKVKYGGMDHSGHGAQGVANSNRTQAPKVVVPFHFHLCHEFGSKKPPK